MKEIKGIRLVFSSAQSLYGKCVRLAILYSMLHIVQEQ